MRVEDYEAYYKKKRADSNCGFAEEFEVKRECNVRGLPICMFWSIQSRQLLQTMPSMFSSLFEIDYIMSVNISDSLTGVNVTTFTVDI